MKIDKKYPRWFYLILILLPIFFLVLLEISLRIFNYGRDNRQWIEAGKGKLTLNNYIAARYFNSTENAPQVLSSSFDKNKKTNAFRVFILGESSAAGFPYIPNGSFSDYVEDRLKLNYPNTPIEVINMGITATNSYAWLDLLPGIIEQKPDLVIIYGGHNEYYGVLGAASTISFGSSPSLIKFNLWLNNLKIAELTTNIIKYFSSLFSSPSAEDRSTLMAKLAKGQHVEYNSELYKTGVTQFENNLTEIVKELKKNHIKVILSTLVSNIKDQKPFISNHRSDIISADTIYLSAMNKIKAGDLKSADSLLRLAKDLDMLRFRAPESFNFIIKKIAQSYYYPVADIETLFVSESPDGIIGDNLMTDHLHPNLEGYQLMGRKIYEVMEDSKYLPKTAPETEFTIGRQDSLVKANFHFSRLDSQIANHRIRILKNDWPYLSKPGMHSIPVLIDFSDTLAYAVASGSLGWGKAHQTAAEYYYRKRNAGAFHKEYDVLVNTFPDNDKYFSRLVTVLIDNKMFNEAYPYLLARYKNKPDAYSSKWLGCIHFFRRENAKAIQYLEKSMALNENDPDVYFYLTGAYGRLAEFEKALAAIKKCLMISPGYPNAKAALQLAQYELNKRNSTGLKPGRKI